MIGYLKNESGTALLIALSILAMLSIIGIVAMQTSSTDMDLAHFQSISEKSLYIADAGAKQAIVVLQSNAVWRDGYANTSFASGLFTVTLTDSLTDLALSDTVLITSTGRIDGAESVIEVTMIPEYINPFSFAMFAESGISLDRETCTDSYNSDSGSYTATVLDTLGDVGTNGTITSSRQVNFGGGLQTATPGGISLGAANKFNGDTTTTADSVKLDIVPATEFDWAKSVSKAMTGISGSNYTYKNGTNNLTVGSFGNMVLSSGVYYFSDITLGQGSNISLAPGASVTIYVTGTIDLNQNSTINEKGNPSDLLIYSSGTALTFRQDNIFNGAFYGPKAHIQYDQTTQVYGSLIGGTIRLDKGACFHYDRNLGKVVRRATGNMERFAWREL